MVLFDPEGRVNALNPAALALFGVAKEEDVRHLTLFEEPHLPREAGERLRAGETVRITVPYDFDEVRARRLYPTSRTGRLILEALLTPFGTKRRPGGILLHVQDVTRTTRDRHALERALSEAERLREETAGLLAGARAVLEVQDFPEASQRIYTLCRDLLGAETGYVALRSADGRRNEVSFLDGGGAACGLGPGRSMKIKGLQRETYRAGRAVWRNHLKRRTGSGLPDGHVPLDSVLYAPIAFGGAVAGTIALANKRGGFRARDAAVATSFGELAAVALMNSRAAERVERSLREKEVLLREVHHRVKNNLQVVIALLTLQLESVADTDARRAFRESMDRIRSMALIHERLLNSRSLSGIRMQGYLDELVGHLLQAYGAAAGGVRAAVWAGDIVLGIDVAVTCGLIVNELVSNALKHAFAPGRPGRLGVRLSPRAGGSVALVVTDNGRGFPVDRPAGHPGGTGIQLVRVLAEKLGGAVRLKDGRGVRFEVVFPPRS